MNVVTTQKLRIRFTKGDFSSPLLGNVWKGREATLNAATAKRFVSMGVAEFIDAAAAEKQDRQNQDAGANTPAEAKDSGPQGGDNGDLSGMEEANNPVEEPEDGESDGESEDSNDLESLSVKKLKKLADEEEVDLHGITAKADIIAAIRAARKAE